MLASRNKVINFLKNDNAIIILVLMAILSSFFVDGMTRQFDTVILEASIYGILAVGLGVVLVTGNIDLSIGFQAATCSIVTVSVFNMTNGNFLFACVATLVAGAAMGLFNAFTVVKLGITPLIATIAANYIYQGIVYYFTRSGAFYPDGDLRKTLQNVLYNNQLFDMRALSVTVLIFVAALIVLYIFMKRTRTGISLYITGDNSVAGALAGISVDHAKVLAYLICGLCCAIGGLFMASRSGAAIYSQGEGKNVLAISACVIGGVKMAGGKGTMVNVLIGILIMRFISTAMNQMLIPTAWVDFVSGALLVIILIIDKFTAIKKEQ